MKSAMRLGIGLVIGVALVGVCLSGWAPAVEPASAGLQTAQAAGGPRTVELFEAMERGEIGVKLIPKDSTQCKLLIENKTKQPLTVKVPGAFAGVPVLAQVGNQGIGGNNFLGGGGNQGFGGGMGGWGGGLFNVAPEAVGQLRCPAVCLEHGKKDPRPGIPYQIKPIEQFTDNEAVHEVVRMLSAGAVPQRVAQAAVWHLNNGLSWQQLAGKQLRFADGTSRPYFSPLEIRAGMQVAAAATRLAEQRHSGPSASDSASTR